VNDPKTMLWFRNRLKSLKFISKATINIKYKRPTVPNRVIPISFEIRFNPWGPIIIPANRSPIISGILTLLDNNGKNKKLNISIENAITGSVIGL
jgi:hypothetical protein